MTLITAGHGTVGWRACRSGRWPQLAYGGAIRPVSWSVDATPPAVRRSPRVARCRCTIWERTVTTAESVLAQE